MFASFSLLVAFIAGLFALFAPCCIGFLLPSYFGTIFKERKKVLALTAIFALGIFTVFLPIGLGVGAIGLMLTRFHDPFFYLGSAMLVLLGVSLLFGKMPMFHIALPSRTGKTVTFGTVYTLGIFSGIGSACCAPVFAGVAALSALSGTPLGGAVLAAAYVFGMVAPLFALSWTLDRSRLLERLTILQKNLAWRVGPIKGEPIAAHLIAGFVFVAAGAVVAWLTATGRVMGAVIWRDTVQVTWAEKIEQWVPWLASIPDALWLTAFILVVGLIVIKVWRDVARHE